MIAEAIKAFVELARSGMAIQRFDVDDPRKSHFYTNGNPLLIDLPIPPRDHTVATLEEIIRLATRFSGPAGGCSPVVWYNEEAVTLVLDDNGHRLETVGFPLTYHPTWELLRQFATTKAKHDHKSFIRLLRIDLDTALAPSALLEIVRKVKFENGTITDADRQRTRESIGKSIVASVSTEREIPDFVVVKTAVYQDSGEDAIYGVTCAVEVDSLEGWFRLVPMPGELIRVQQRATDSIGVRLREGLPEDVPEYRGCP